jgi:hypothetical protein
MKLLYLTVFAHGHWKEYVANEPQVALRASLMSCI